MRSLDMDKMLRDVDTGKGPDALGKTNRFYDKYAVPPKDKDKKKDDKAPVSKLPASGKLKGRWGDVGKMREQESRAAGGFKKGKAMTWPK